MMLGLIDLMDKDLYFKTPLFNTMIKKYIATYGKDCVFYINPNHEGRDHDDFYREDVNDKSIELVNDNPEQAIKTRTTNNSQQRTDNYTLAYGKDMVQLDFNKLQKYSAKILADFGSYYTHEVGGEDSVSFYLQLKDTPISRGDIISYKIQDKELFYRISNPVQSYMEIVYKIQCKLVQVNRLGGGYRPYDIHQHKPEAILQPHDGIIL